MAETPPSTRDTAEQLAARLGAARGRWTIELRVKDGVLEEVFLHERIPATQLENNDLRAVQDATLS